MKRYPVITKNASETQALGAQLAKFLKPGNVIGFEGPLGAGKTTFIQGLCAALGVEEKVVSPTFVLMHVYDGKLPIYHFDLYRLEPKDFQDLGWDDYLGGRGISLVEWVDRSGRNFPYPHLLITLEYGETPDTRKIEFKPQKIEYPWLAEFLNHWDKKK